MENSTMLLALEMLYEGYYPIHGVFSIILCVVGIVLNTLHMIVLSRPNMMSTVNVVLSAIAVCDIGLMASYLIYICTFHIPEKAYYELSEAYMLITHANFSVTIRGIAIWLAVLVAILRKQALRRQVSSKPTIPQTTGIILLISVTITILNTPIYVMNGIEMLNTSSNSTTFYVITRGEPGDLLETVSFWLNGVVLKLVPLALICVFLLLLWVGLKKHERKRKNLKIRQVGGKSTTQVLLAVLAITLVCEGPNALLSIIVGTHPSLQEAYLSMGDVLDFLTLINCVATFILYAVISQKYRDTFKQLFCRQAATISRQLMSQRHNKPYNAEKFEEMNPGTKSLLASSSL